MLQKTKEYIKQHHMAEKGEKIVIGLSGGIDSVCLFYLLKMLGYSLEAVHVHHGIRGSEADRDEEFVKALCETMEVPFHGFRFDVPKISKQRHLSVEEAGRMLRRQAFAQVMKESGADAVALAHHGNDRAETFLFHLGRGTGIKGLASMRPVEGVYIRPLLWAQRSEIEQYVKNNGWSFVEDHTNQEDEYTRNRIRHQMIPLFETINPKSVEHIMGAAQKLSMASDYIEKMADGLCRDSVEFGKNEVMIRKADLFLGDPVLHIPVLQKCVEYFKGSLVNITEEHLQKLLQLFGQQTGKEIHLPGKLVAVRSYEGVRLSHRKEEEIKDPVCIQGNGIYEYGTLRVSVSVETWNVQKSFPIKNYTKCFDYDKITGSVFLRSRKSGDYLEINKDHGKKSLQDYLVNEKVPKAERDRIVLLADGSHVLWVVGKRISEYYKVTEKTEKILKVQISGGNVYEEF